jgi:hypothetical protein
LPVPKRECPGRSPGINEEQGLDHASHRPDFDHIGHEVAQQILDAVLQRRG